MRACFGKRKTIGLARASCGNDCGHGREESGAVGSPSDSLNLCDVLK